MSRVTVAPARNSSNATENSAELPDSEVIRVVVGVLEDRSGQVLIAQRRPGTHMAGSWEFPGGKQRDGESAFRALQRELHEELAVEVAAARPLLVLEHRYEDRHVRLDTWLVTSYRGEPHGCEGQPLRWVRPAALHRCGLLAADAPIVAALIERSDA